MLKILSGEEVKLLDGSHQQRTGSSSLDLMERAALGFVSWWMDQRFDVAEPVAIFCGAGNNGGDGFAIARLLHKAGFQVSVYRCFSNSATLSQDALINFKSLSEEIPVKSWQDFSTEIEGIVIDAFLGVGLKGELRSEAKEIVEKINLAQGSVIAVDLPSGLPADDLLAGDCVEAEATVTFAFPKLALLFPEHAKVTGELVLVDIGLEEEDFKGFLSSKYFLRESDIPGLHRRFHRFSHKGDFGKVLLCAGSKGKIGAAVLCSAAALRTGSGLVTVMLPEAERQILQTALPEVMCQFDLPHDLSAYDALGIGPGLGFEQKAEFLKSIFLKFTRPVVLDADVLTLLGQEPELLALVPKGSILTPHLKELERLIGATSSHLMRLEKAAEFCQKWKLNLLIKGANSVICLEDGRQIFNSSGSQHMATAGAGDVLTGMLTSLLGQGYSPENALLCGVFQHGLAGELAGKSNGRGTIASDLVRAIPETFIRLGV